MLRTAEVYGKRPAPPGLTTFRFQAASNHDDDLTRGLRKTLERRTGLSVVMINMYGGETDGARYTCKWFQVMLGRWSRRDNAYLVRYTFHVRVLTPRIS